MFKAGNTYGLHANARVEVTDEQVDVEVLGVPFFIHDLDRPSVSTVIAVDGEGAASPLRFEAVESVGAEVFNMHQGVRRAGGFGLFGDELLVGDVKRGVAYGADSGDRIEEANAHQLG